MFRTGAEEGRTVLFSSHLLDEVERVADQVIMRTHGKVVLDESLDSIKSRHRVITVRFTELTPTAPQLPGLINLQGSDGEWKFLCPLGSSSIRQTAASLGIEILAETAPTLEEIFVTQSLV